MGQKPEWIAAGGQEVTHSTQVPGTRVGRPNPSPVSPCARLTSMRRATVRGATAAHATAGVGSLCARVHVHVHADSEKHEAYTRATSACLGAHTTQGSRVRTGPHGCAPHTHRCAMQPGRTCMLSPPPWQTDRCVLPERLPPPCCYEGRTSTPTESPRNRTRRPGVSGHSCAVHLVQADRRACRLPVSSRAWCLLGWGREAGLRLLRRLGTVPEKSNPLPSSEC